MKINVAGPFGKFSATLSAGIENECSAGIFKQSMGAGNQVGIRL
jgi:hypothetical protein